MEMEYELPNESGQGTFDSRLLNDIKLIKFNESDNNILERIPNVEKLVDNSGRTLLHYAVESDSHGAVLYLANETEVDIGRRDCEGKTAIVLARTPKTLEILLGLYGNFDLTEIIYGHGSESDFREFLNNLGRHRGCNIEIANKLIDLKYSAHSAIIFRRAQVTRMLLEHDSRLNPKSSYCPGDLLVSAMKLSDMENFRVLIDHGIHVDAKCSFGQTAMSTYPSSRFADPSQRLEILRLMLDRGANPMKIITTDHGHLMRAGEMQMAPILKSQDRATIRVMMEANIDLTMRDDNDSTAIHYMASNPSPDIFAELEGKRYYVNALNDRESTPLHLVDPTNLRTVRALCASGANINAEDDEERTPLIKIWQNDYYQQDHLPIDWYSYQNSARVVEYLLNHGADPQATSMYNFTIYSYAGSRCKSNWLTSALMQLSIIEARGTPVNRVVDREMRCAYTSLKDRFDTHKRELQNLRKVKIWKSVTAYDILIDDERKIEYYMRNRKFRLCLYRRQKAFEYSANLTYYTYVLRHRLATAMNSVNMRKKASVNLCRAIGLPHVVVDKITSYLRKSDLKKLCRDANDK